MKNNYQAITPNETLCLEKIISYHTISRAELSVITGLNKATISTIVKKLMNDHLVVEIGQGNSTSNGGRKPIMLRFNGRAGLSLSFDIGYNYVTALLTYLDGEEIHSISKKPIDVQEETLPKLLLELFTEMSELKPKTPLDIIGVVLGIHGPVSNNEIVFTPHYNLSDVAFKGIFAEVCDYPVYLENSANLAALGEYAFISTSSNMASISMYSGIGAGIIKKGELLRGSHGFIGEIGHQIVAIDGKKCTCGNDGCLEQYCSRKVVFDNFAKLKNLDSVNTEILRDYYQNGDEDAIAVIRENVSYLSLAVNNLIIHQDPQVITIDSSIYHEIPDMIEQLNAHLKNKYSKDIIVRNSVLKDRSSLLGGLILNLQEYLKLQFIRINRR